jgi:hypothetical protein
MNKSSQLDTVYCYSSIQYTAVEGCSASTADRTPSWRLLQAKKVGGRRGQEKTGEDRTEERMLCPLEVVRNRPRSGGNGVKSSIYVSYAFSDKSQFTITDMDCSSMESTRYKSPGSSLPKR